jgi:hypothetical protein
MERLLISPAGAVHLAASLCVNQAFSYGDQVYGLQFHLKVDEAMILRWLKVSEIGTRSPELHSGVNPDHILGQRGISGGCTNSAIRRSAISSHFRFGKIRS